MADVAVHNHWWIVPKQPLPPLATCRDCKETRMMENRLPFDGNRHGKRRSILSQKGADMDAAYREARRIAQEAM